MAAASAAAAWRTLPFASNASSVPLIAFTYVGGIAAAATGKGVDCLKLAIAHLW